MYFALLQTHSVLRYILLALLLLVIVRSLYGRISKSPFAEIDNRLGIYLMIAAHLQLVTGLILYFISPLLQTALADMGAAMKDATLRFWAVEHLTLMLLAVIVITVGRILSKRAVDDAIKFRRALAYYSLGLIFILAGMPWERWLG